LKTRVVKKNCNPVWNEEMTVAIKDPNVPIRLVNLKRFSLLIQTKDKSLFCSVLGDNIVVFC